jgi:predicted CxxxxCH...CXXCH cytochrome family protein
MRCTNLPQRVRNAYTVLAIIALASCDLGHYSGDPLVPDGGGGDSTSCAGACHGSGGEAAPPRDTAGRSDLQSIGVGAHRQHLAGSAWHKNVECASCHLVPAEVGDPGHIDTPLPAELTFSGMGAGGTWNRDTQTCSSTYCHGATLSSTIDNATGSAGGTATEPVWTTVDGSQAQCGSCHGAPPPAPHPSDPDCGHCHPTMNPGGGLVIAYPELHIDGHVDVVDTQACDSCHGAGGQSAPPKDTTGATATTARGVGAHAQHMTASSPWHAPIACSECHKVPAGVNDQGHIDSPLPAELTFGPLAGAASQWNGTSCSATYCHGGGGGPLTGGSKTTPKWTQVDGTQSQCGSCHGAPPPPPHPTDSDCGSCHPTMTPGGGLTITYPALHIDGKVDLIQDQPCDSCHGSGGNAAPPKDTTGGTSTDLRGVGAHRNHLGASTWRKEIACEACHKVPTAVTSIGHIDSALPAEVIFSALAGKATWNGSTCANTYCHGSSLGGGTSKNPVWTVVNGVQGQCGSCHGTPPPPPHPVDSDCGKCHNTMTPGGGLVITDPSRHIDGNLDVTGDQPCNSCHGGTTNAPPKDTLGNTATTARGVGAHQQHLAPNGPYKPVDCADCHRVPTSTTSVGHIDTPLPAELTFSVRAGTAGVWNGSRCSNTYCHGAGAPTWTKVDGTQATCTSCHGNPPPAPHPQNVPDCGQCHPDVVRGSPTQFSDPLKHVDGNVDVTGDQACNSCHGGTNNAPPKDTSGATATTTRGVGAHQAHTLSANWHRTVQCNECHVVPTSVGSAGHIDTPLPAELVFSGIGKTSTWNGSTCTSYCHGAAAPIWTKVDGSQKQCTSCHGNPPPAPHPNDSNCSNCHPDGGTGGTFSQPAQHIDGTLQVTSVHPPGYAQANQHGFDFDRHGPSTCATASCHGTALTGGNSGGPACTSCHAQWQTSCTFCHGGTSNATGAPPAGVEGATAANQRQVGAHDKHVGATALHSAWDCNYCHTKPSTALTPGHVDGTGGVVQAELVFSSLNPSSLYSTTTNTCSGSYCHGTGLATKTTPAWTSTTPIACVDGCHGGDPNRTAMSSYHRISDHKKACNRCHQNVVDATPKIINAGLHVNGTRNVQFSAAGSSYNTSTKSCTGTGTGCHGTGTKSGWR